MTCIIPVLSRVSRQPVARYDTTGLWKLLAAGNSKDAPLEGSQAQRFPTLVPFWLKADFSSLPDPFSRVISGPICCVLGGSIDLAGRQTNVWTPSTGAQPIDNGPDVTADWNDGTDRGIVLPMTTNADSVVQIVAYLKTACDGAGVYTDDADHALLECAILFGGTSSWAARHFFQKSISVPYFGAADVMDVVATLTYQYSGNRTFGGAAYVPPTSYTSLAGKTIAITQAI